MDMHRIPDFEKLVDLYYPALYRFAFSLTHQESDAVDLTQQTFYIWARKGHQLEEADKVKSWLFTTLHREYLQQRRKTARFTPVELDESDPQLPVTLPPHPTEVDGSSALQALAQLDPVFQAPLALFYLEDCSYLEIGRILEIPLGTVKSRIARGLAQLQEKLVNTDPGLRRKEACESQRR